MEALEEAGLFTHAAAILRPILEYGNKGDSVEVCQYLKVRHGEFDPMPEFAAELAQFLKYCTDNDHALAALRLKSQGKPLDAAQELEVQIHTNPRYPEAFPDLVNLYIELGQVMNASRVLKQLLMQEWSETTKCRVLGDIFPRNTGNGLAGDDTDARLKAECKNAWQPRGISRITWPKLGHT